MLLFNLKKTQIKTHRKILPEKIEDFKSERTIKFAWHSYFNFKPLFNLLQHSILKIKCLSCNINEKNDAQHMIFLTSETL